MFEDILVLGSGHTLITGHKPKGIGEQILSDSIFKNSKVEESLSSFGLFSGMNYNTFYPELKPEDIAPKDDEFIEPIYRLLSECIVSKYQPTDFSQNDVLKNSMHLLIGQTINCDHETDTGNAIGAIKGVIWQESYTDTVNGKKITVPAGINGLMKIDAKSNPRLARGILMTPPSIHSNSVTVRFTWVPSHPKMDINEFYDRMGTYDDKGELVRRVVTEIICYMETSLVSAGADPFAKQIRDGKIVLPETASANSFSEKGMSKKTPSFYIDYKDLNRMETIHNTMVFNYERETNLKNKDNMNEELKLFLASLFGDGVLTLSEGTEPSTATAISLIQSLVTENATIAKLKAENATIAQLKTDNSTLTENLRLRSEELATAIASKPDAEILSLGTSTLNLVRNEAIANYKKVAGTTPDETILAMLGTANHTTINALNSGYVQQLEEKFPIVCGECGSHNVSRASSQTENESTTENSEEVRDTQSSIAKLREQKLR